MNEMKFEEAMERLEEIVKKLEMGDLPLDESLKMFEEGISLSRFCNKKLNDAEHKISKLIEKNGEIVTEDFE